ncbi:MAG TPA: hypothetical protein VHN99_01660 [Deinococcales bacterium]|nr:hypothetical protein [Deinococcales bacterium]
MLYDPKVMNGRPLDERGIDASLAQGLIVENDAPPAAARANA